MTPNLLCLNSVKTEFCCYLLGLKSLLNKIHNPTLLLTDGHSTPAASARNLGFIFYFSFSDHIASVSRACFYHIRDLRRIRHVDFDTARTIDTSFVYSRLEYCNSMYYCLPQMQLNRFQHIQNALARAVVAPPRSANLDHILKSLHRLKVQERIEYKVISTTHELIQSSSSGYLCDLITVQPSRSTRSSTLVTRFQSSVDSSLKIHMWTKLPPTLRLSYQFDPSSSPAALLHRHTLILDRLSTFLAAFSILVLKLPFSPSLFLHSRSSLPRAHLET